MLGIASPLGGDVEKICHFQSWAKRSHGSILLATPIGGDVERIGDFQSKERILRWTQFKLHRAARAYFLRIY